MAPWYKVVLLYLWIAPHTLLVAVPVIMVVRRLHKNFPFFFVYSLYETLGFLLRFAVYLRGSHSNSLYRYVFALTLAGSVALRFGIIQEIFNNVFRDYPRLEGIAARLMRWVTGVLLIAAVITAIYSAGVSPENLMTGVALLDRCVVIVQAGLLLFLFLFASTFGLSWGSVTFGIALGFGVLASTELAVSAMHLTRLTEGTANLLDLVRTGSYHVTVLVWLGYLVKAEKTVNAASSAAPELDRWSGELEHLS
jgi:hypothetical protein